MTRISSDYVYENGKAKVVDVIRGEQAKIQAIGSGTYSLKGRLSADCDFDDIALIKASDFVKSSTISDNSVWVADISGYSQITVEADGVDKIYMTIIG